jgi:hypothetical protein
MGLQALKAADVAESQRLCNSFFHSSLCTEAMTRSSETSVNFQLTGSVKVKVLYYKPEGRWFETR